MDANLVPGLSLQAGSRPKAALLRHEFRAMGVQMMAALESDAPFGRLSLEQVPRWFEDWEQTLSRFRLDSELSLLNASNGQPVSVSSDMWEVLQAAISAAEETQGLVTPTVLGALESAGYDRTFSALAGSEIRPSPGAAQAVPGWRQVELEPGGRTVRLPEGVRLDFGGVAKGWAADRAAAALEPLGPALVDAGGDIAVNGHMLDGSPWPVGVTNPFDPDGQIALLRLHSGGVATSGRDYRKWNLGGREMHHVIDPRTAEPARTDLLSVTVVAPSALAAEVAAKAALVLGSVEGMAWIEARPDLAGLLVLDDGSLLQSSAFSKYVWR